MATYQYLCANCGPFDRARPMGAASAAETCPACGASARRAWTVPSLPRLERPLARALAASEKSTDQPEVVQRVPAAPRRPALPPDPRHAKLPRP